jgi:ornithine cyclodeaminase/alanine dehydrogenase-like protein (mu-crystallin family)
MKVLILNQTEISQLLTMQECMDVMQKAFIALAAGRVLLPLRQIVWLPGGESVLAVMPSYSDHVQSIGAKVISVFPRNLGTQFDSHQGVVLLFETQNGCLRAVMDASEITAIRTAAVSGVATRTLSRQDASDVAILGSGVQAKTHLEAMLLARDVKRVRVWSRNFANAQRFASRQSERHNRIVEAVEHAQDAVTGADIVCTVTSSRTPVLQGEWLHAGAHVNAVGTFGPASREIDTTTVVCAKLFTDRRESALKEAGDIMIPIQEGKITPDSISGELGEVLAGTVAGRSSNNEITVFKSLGLAIEDLASAHYLYEKAFEKGIGTFVELGGNRHDP